MLWLNRLIARLLPYVPKPLVGHIAKPYIAGERLEDAVKTVKDLMSQGACATIDLLGEEIKRHEEALQALESYKNILHAIEGERLDSNISVKLTHMGLKLDKEFCYQNIHALVVEAKKHNNFVRIDMEDSTCTDDSIEIYLRLRKDFSNVGIVLQSYMRRTIDDINRLFPVKPNIRVVKGAYYYEPREIVYKDAGIINQNYSYITEKLLTNNCYVAIATHDEKLTWEGMRLVDKLKLKKDEYELQMLLGVDPELRRIIISQGHRLRVYIPYGKDWFAYSIRRLKENPKMVNYILKQTFQRAFKQR